MPDTDEDKFRRTDEERNRRETELYLLLWMLWDEARLHGQSAIRLGHDPGQAMRQVIQGNPQLDLPGALPPIREILASADIAGQRRAIRLAGVPTHQVETPDAEEIEPEYTAEAKELADSLSERATTTADQYARVSTGLSVAQRVKILREAMQMAWGPNGGELKNASSTPILTAHNGGMWKGYKSELPRIIAFRHYSVMDDRTTDICWQRHLLTLPPDDSYWLKNWPSLHWGPCRSVVLPVRQGEPCTFSTTYPTIPPMPGFGFAPMPGYLPVIPG
jgi:hypothetical protein